MQAGARVHKKRRQLSVVAYVDGAAHPPPPTSRGVIKGWNEGMANRLGGFIANFREDFTVMVTLTYPETFPSDGETVKRHLRAFWERLRRTGWLEKNSAVWFLEFQERGAPHFHFLATDFISRFFVARAWAEITGGDPRACSRCEAIRHPDRAGAYARKYAMKAEQKEVPRGFERVGRMWGCVGARIGSTGLHRLPSVAAAIEGVDFKGIISASFSTEAAFTGKVVRTLSGWVFYGSEREVERLWQSLQASELFIGRTVHKSGNLMQRPSGALHARLERLASRQQRSWKQSDDALTPKSNATASVSG
jgi:hypothetical protein